MSVSRRVVLSVGLLMLLALGVLAYQLSIVVRMQRINKEISEVSFVAASRLLDMERDADELDSLSRRYLGLDEGHRKDLDSALGNAIDDFDLRLKELSKGLHAWEAPGEIAVLNDHWTQYKSQIEGLRRVLPEGGLEKVPQELLDTADQLITQTRSARNAVLSNMQAEVSRNQSMGSQAQSISWVAAWLFVITGGGIAYFTLRAINSPLRELTRGTRSIASGEFTHRLPIEGPTEFAELARDFNSMTEKLGELDRMKKEFVAHVSHELKAPLAAIRQTLDVTLEQVPGPINETQRRLLQLSRTSAERLSAMVANLLDVSRLEAGTMEYEMGPQDIVGIVIQVVEEFSLKASEKNITITVQSVAPSIEVICDPDRMTQVIGNIVDNALKFSPQDSTIQVEVSHNLATSTAIVSVADCGNGVPDDHKEKVFEKFHQIKGKGKRTAGQGVGLGLAICKTIIDAHRGRIWVEDNPGGGSVFRVQMRSAQVKEAVKCG